MPTYGPNDDEDIRPHRYIGNFHKSLPHDEFGLVDRVVYEDFRDRCESIGADQPPFDFEGIPWGECPESYGKAQFTNPLAGAAVERHGPDPRVLGMAPAPGILSESSAAEMVELYWMALLRDKPLDQLNAHAADAVTDVTQAYAQAINQDQADCAVALVTDLPAARAGNIQLDIRPETLFGCGLHGEDAGPRISQFFLQPIPYGVQTIEPMQYPYVAEQDFLTEFSDWLCVQNTGTDRFGRDYGKCNYFGDQQDGHVTYYGNEKRYISTMRDLARFVNRDALHQAYFNAALLLDALGAPVDPGNPYHSAKFAREHSFGTLGGPDLLTLVSEVASRALKAVWRQKWMVHRRCRPEVFGGLIHVQEIGNAGHRRKDFEISPIVTGSLGARTVQEQCGSFLLPMAFSAG